MAMHLRKNGADGIALLHISGPNDPYPSENFALPALKEWTELLQGPVEVGGGVRSVADVEALLNAGATRVCIGTASIWTPEVVKEAVCEFGGKRIVAALDVVRNPKMSSGREVVTHNGQILSGVDAVKHARKMADLGVTGLLATSLFCEGALWGYDVEMSRQLAALGIPVSVNGGAGTLAHFREALVEGKATVLMASSVFLSHMFTPNQVKAYLAIQGIATDKPPKLTL